MTSDNKVIEQLWYTWSNIGIDLIRAGYRIRAGSEGLRDPRSELVQRLNRYQSYLLPRDADRSIDPKLAPICLALINTGKEHILVHKVYTGKDGIGRYGAFFIHLLALPEEVSPTDAILLWQSPFWQKSDASLRDRRSTELERVPLADLKEESKKRAKEQSRKRALDPQSKKQIQQYLPPIIEAYLTKNLLREKQGSQQAPQQIYIAASDNDVAQLISGLIQSLPPQLVKDLTFSTYESNVDDATTEIVGTCWLSEARAEKNPIVAHLLPPHYYQERLAFNCYLPDPEMSSRLENHPLVLNHPLAHQCAEDATEYFLDSNSSPEFQNVLDEARDHPDLNVTEFLELYKMFGRRGQPASPSDFDKPHSPEIWRQMLSRSDYRQMLIQLVLNDPNWWANHKKIFSLLRQRSSRVPRLGQALAKIAFDAIPVVVDIVKKEVTSPREITFSNDMVDVMRCVAPPQEEPVVWSTLLKQLLLIKPMPHLLRNHRNIYAELMGILSLVFPPSEENNQLVDPLLSVSWADFGDFLTLQLPLDWVEIATKKLVLTDQSPQPGKAEISHLEQHHHTDIEKLLEQLSQDPQRWLTATALFHTLITGAYPQKMSLLSALLHSLMGKNESTVIGLLQAAKLTSVEKSLFLENYGPYHLSNNTLEKTLLGMLADLARSNFQPEKMRVLFSWLDSTRLALWFDSPQTGIKNLGEVLTTASLNTDELGQFFQKYGEKYILLYPGSPTLISLFDSYAKSAGSKAELRISLLNTWFKFKLDEVLLTQVLEAAHLTGSEKVSFLQYYGERYLSRYPQSPLLINYVQELLNFLRNTNITIFKGNQSAKEPSATEKLLRFLADFPPIYPSVPQSRVLDWYQVARFVRQPSLLRHSWASLTPHIGRLLNSPDELQPAMRPDLLMELATACLASKDDPRSTIDNMRSVLSLPNMVQLLYSVAKSVDNSISQNRYAKTLLVPCILYALDFQAKLSPEAKQEFSVQRFLNTLLQHADEETLNWLNTQANHWHPIYSAEWRRYTAQRQPPIRRQVSEPQPVPTSVATDPLRVWIARFISPFKTQERPRWLVTLFVLLALLILSSSIGGVYRVFSPDTNPSAASPTPVACVPGTITVGGSNALESFVKHAAQMYQATCDKAAISSNLKSSTDGLGDMDAGRIQISIFDLSSSNPDLTDHPVAVAIYALILNPKVGLTNLSIQQIQGIYNGSITNWNQIHGGPDLPITVVSRPPTLEIRTVFEHYVLKSQEALPSQSIEAGKTDDTLKTVQSNSGAIGYVDLTNAKNSNLSIVQIDGVAESPESVENGSYPFWVLEHMYTKGQPSGLTKAFLDYMGGDQGKQAMQGLPYLPVSDMPPDTIKDHPSPVAPGGQ